MLAALYTDSSACSLLGKMAGALRQLAPDSLRRVANRQTSGVPANKVHSSDRMYFLEWMQRLTFCLPRGMQLYHQRHRILSRKMIAWGLNNADIIYSMHHEDLDFIRWAKARGAKSAVDVFINPETPAIMQREQEQFPDWGQFADRHAIELENRLWQETAELADILLCPSEWVAEGVQRLSPKAASKIRVVPYGCSIDYQGRVNQPVKGRILFAGGDALRKGLHYLGQAATNLKKVVRELDVRVAGALPDKVIHHPVCKHLNFLGKLTSEQMKAEYLSADVFVLPALSEGFAGVVAEAIGAGCPVIVTKETGSPIVHEREGLLISSNSSTALAVAMTRMVTDREFRDGCSAQCLQQVSFYSESEWGKRLTAAIRSV